MNKLDACLGLEVNGTGHWFAIRKAEELRFNCHAGDSWSTETDFVVEDILNSFSGKLVWEDYCPSDKDHEILVEAKDSIILIENKKVRRRISVSAFTTSRDKSEDVIELLKKKIPTIPKKEKLLRVNFWYHTNHGPRSYERHLKSARWNEIRENYVEPARQDLEKLLGHEFETDSGKLILWQGDPGTGKTWALRAIGEEWSDWCRIHYILDPEKFFAEGDYLLTVLLGEDEHTEENGREPWRLVVLEDCGEMLTKDAKQQVGQGLSRLLNICDGLVGQGLRVLVLITTNEHLGSLHSAISRQGRCLSQTAFQKFSAAEADAWLKAHGTEELPNKSANLSELYGALNGSQISKKSRSVGYTPV